MRRIVLAVVLLAVGTAACGASSASRVPGGAATAAPAHQRSSPAPVWPADPAATPYDGVTYEDPGANPYVPASRDRESTFALDVDTASYAIARRYVDDGNLPDPASVRVEEFVNAFDQGYPSPEDGDFGIYADGGPSPFLAEGEVLVRIGIQARDVSRRQRPDAALTFVVDTSGSMAREDRLELVKRSLAVLVDQLRPSDTVAIVELRHGRPRRPGAHHRPGPRPDPRRARRAVTGRLHQRGGRPAARVSPCRGPLPRGRDQPGHPRVGRRRQHRQHGRRDDPGQDRVGRQPGDPARDRRVRHGQLQRRPDGAARRQG